MCSAYPPAMHAQCLQPSIHAQCLSLLKIVHAKNLFFFILFLEIERNGKNKMKKSLTFSIPNKKKKNKKI